VIPQVDSLEADGVTREERRLWEETRRVLECPELAINATAVRVPVFFGHSLSVHASSNGRLDPTRHPRRSRGPPAISVIRPRVDPGIPDSGHVGNGGRQGLRGAAAGGSDA